MNDFEGSDYVRELDQKRLTGQLARVFAFMSRQGWWTLSEIEKATGDPQASISAQLRHLRKYKWGAHEVDKRRRGELNQGLFEYRLTVNGRLGQTELFTI